MTAAAGATSSKPADAAAFAPLVKPKTFSQESQEITSAYDANFETWDQSITTLAPHRVIELATDTIQIDNQSIESLRVKSTGFKDTLDKLKAYLKEINDLQKIAFDARERAKPIVARAKVLAPEDAHYLESDIFGKTQEAEKASATFKQHRDQLTALAKRLQPLVSDFEAKLAIFNSKLELREHPPRTWGDTWSSLGNLLPFRAPAPSTAPAVAQAAPSVSVVVAPAENPATPATPQPAPASAPVQASAAVVIAVSQGSTVEAPQEMEATIVDNKPAPTPDSPPAKTRSAPAAAIPAKSVALTGGATTAKGAAAAAKASVAAAAKVIAQSVDPQGTDSESEEEEETPKPPTKAAPPPPPPAADQPRFGSLKLTAKPSQGGTVINNSRGGGSSKQRSA